MSLFASAISKWTLFSTDTSNHNPVVVAWPGCAVAFPHDLASRPGCTSAANAFHSNRCLPEPVVFVVYIDVYIEHSKHLNT
jgi:hypothetical protein